MMESLFLVPLIYNIAIELQSHGNTTKVVPLHDEELRAIHEKIQVN